MKFGLHSKIAQWLVSKSVITEEDKSIYEYGIQEGFMILLNIFTLALLGLVFGIVGYSLLFYAVYIPLRQYAGGYHAKTRLRCYLSSAVTMVLVLVFLKYAPMQLPLLIGLAVISAVLIIIFSPVESLNKPLRPNEVKVYRRRTRLILVVELLVIISLAFLGWYQVMACLVMSLTLVALLVVIGQIQLQVIQRRTVRE